MTGTSRSRRTVIIASQRRTSGQAVHPGAPPAPRRRRPAGLDLPAELREGLGRCRPVPRQETSDAPCSVGKPAIHPHRFRHTLGTQLAERGTRVQTIMKVLGHKSPGMSMTYTQISDPTVLADYQAVLMPGAAIAGPLADTLRSGLLDQDALDWLKTNFYKTELELGRCLRLPQEGPCECDLYLSCAKFVTTPRYVPRLRERLCTERQLITDARDRGWEREIERHQRIADRITSLLDDLGEPHDEPAE
ncbi:tyrosine-type recombinase/integrase [Kitasatospora sp. NPDC097643]|uniref:tyrosine-type recombinase/integrase n=1 Tax=Kitasatospora sp. NPDC097643 TaxID=3157230 RepID=UPI00332622C9